MFSGAELNVPGMVLGADNIFPLLQCRKVPYCDQKTGFSNRGRSQLKTACNVKLNVPRSCSDSVGVIRWNEQLRLLHDLKI